MNQRRKALGKGLSVLLGSQEVPVASEQENIQAGLDQVEESASYTPDPSQPTVYYIPVSQVHRNEEQPRQQFSEESLQELADSIGQHGVLQPILVTPITVDPTLHVPADLPHYMIVAGERRFRSAQLAGLESVPCLVQHLDREEMLEIAIVENIQRDDLNCVEEARAYRKLIEEFSWTQEQVSQRVGKKRSTVANSLRLLKLGSEALKELEEGKLTAGHARAILSIDDSFYRSKLRQEIVSEGLSVREAERRSLQYQTQDGPTSASKKKKSHSPSEDVDIVALEDRLMVHLGCRVRVKSKDGKSGVVELPFRNPQELEKFFEAIGLPE